MPRITRSARLPHSASEMYRLVHDIEAYPDFLPWCSSAEIVEQSETHQVATIAISKSLKQSRFTTRNRLEPESAIHIALLDGPFRHLDGSWHFTDLDAGGCRAELVVDFAFASRLFGTLMGPAFTRVCDSLVGAFKRRAAVVYGTPSVPSSGSART